METNRPNPEMLLARLAIEEKKLRRGRLSLFFGMAAGVGKTYQMLKVAQERLKEGIDVWIGFVETHGRIDTEKLIEGLPIILRKQVEYKGTAQEEMDMDAVLKKRPQLVLVDELAHTNVPGSRHEKRYQDIIEILDAGIDVYSTMNVQHLESRADIVNLITAVKVRETVPDTILDIVDRVELIDITPDELIKRLKEGKIYPGRKTEQALQYFFQEGNLSALREMVLRVTANKVERDMKSVSKIERPEKLLVAVSPSPLSEKLIRTARRIVEELEIGWVAVHIDTGKILKREDHNQLVKNLELAKELGAESVSLHGTDIAETISDFASQNKVIQMILGRPGAKMKWWQRTPRFIEELIKKNPNIDITVLQQPTVESRERAKRHLRLSIHVGSLMKAISLVVLTSIINYLLNAYIGYRAVGFLFLMLIVVLGISFPLSTVLIAAISSGFIWNYFFIPPRYTFSINSPEDVMMFLSYIAIALTSGLLTYRIKEKQRILKDREEKTRALYEILRSMSLVRDPKSIIEFALKKIEGQFNAECSIFLPIDDSFSNSADYGTLGISENEKAVALWSYRNGRNAGWSTDTLPLSPVMCIPLRSADENYGILIFKPNKNQKLTPDQENLLLSMVGQIGVVLAKQAFDDKNKRTMLIQESEKLHKTILNCVSHELRTPLTAIMGATSALKTQLNAQNANVRTLYEEIIQATEKLNQIFENLLNVTRLEGGSIKLKTEWFDTSELVNSSIDKRKKFLADHKLKLDIPLETIYFFGDFELLEHALSNILLNAANYSPKGSVITVNVKTRDHDKIMINVTDKGPGIPDQFIANVFEKFYRVPGIKPGGLGLGLSISKSLVEIHSGEIIAKNNIDGGSTFSIILPYREPPKEVTG